jgi:hypothetical protein
MLSVVRTQVQERNSAYLVFALSLLHIRPLSEGVLRSKGKARPNLDVEDSEGKSHPSAAQ